MTIAAQLPKSTLDIRGDRLRFLLALALNEVEQQYRLGKTDKATNTLALLAAVQAKLNGMTTVGTIAAGNITADNAVTAAEAASPQTSAITTTNVANGATATVLLDGAANAGVTISALTAGAATVTFTSAVLLALSLGAHTLTVSYTDAAGIRRTVIKGFSRTA